VNVDDIAKAANIAGHRKHKIEVYRKLAQSGSGYLNLIAKDADRTGIIQASIDKARDVEFTLPRTAILNALAGEIIVLENELRFLGVTGLEHFDVNA
jgi:hypothetical protein